MGSERFPYDIPEELAKRRDEFTGRLWVQNRIGDWLRGPERVFLLTGGPGTGKSAFMAHLLDLSRGEAASPTAATRADWPIAYAHFCTAGDDSGDPHGFVEALGEALTRALPGYGAALRSTYDASSHISGTAEAEYVEAGAAFGGVVIQGGLHLHGQSPRSAFNRMVQRPLQMLAKSGHLTDHIIVVVDGLDEALTFPAHENLVDLVASIRRGQDRLPETLKLLVTSRSKDERLRRLGQPSLDLIEDAPPDADDVAAYARRRLRQTLPGTPGADLAARIATAGQGNFLYALYVLNEIVKDPDHLKRPDSIPLPAGLDNHYREYLERELGQNREQWEHTYRPLLGLLAVARGDGLPREVLNEAATLNLSNTDDALLRLDQYLSGDRPNGPFRLYHQSFREFLMREGPFHVYPLESEKALTQYLFDRTPSLLDGHRNWLETPQYVRSYLPIYAANSGRLDELLLDSEFLLHSDVTVLTGVLHLAQSVEAKKNARAYRQVAHHLSERTGSTSRGSYLRLAALRVGAEVLLAGLAEPSVEGPSLRSSADWWPLWAWWTRSLSSMVGGRLRKWPTHLATTHIEGIGSVAVTGTEGAVEVWALEEQERLGVWYLRTADIKSLTVVPFDQTQFVALGTKTGAIHLLELPNLRSVAVRDRAHTDIVWAMCPVTGTSSPMLASGSEDGSIALWHLPYLGPVESRTGAHLGVYSLVATELDGIQVLVSGGDLLDARTRQIIEHERSLRLWTLPDLEFLREFGTGEASMMDRLCIAESSRNRLVLGSNFTHKLHIFNLDTGEPIRYESEDEVKLSRALSIAPADQRELLLYDLSSLRRVRFQDSASGTVHATVGPAMEVDIAKWDGPVPVHSRATLISATTVIQIWDLEEVLGSLADIESDSQLNRLASKVSIGSLVPIGDALFGVANGALKCWKADGSDLAGRSWPERPSEPVTSSGPQGRIIGIAPATLDGRGHVVVGFASGQVSALDALSGAVWPVQLTLPPIDQEHGPADALVALSILQTRAQTLIATAVNLQSFPRRYRLRLWDLALGQEVLDPNGHLPEEESWPLRMSGYMEDKEINVVVMWESNDRSLVAAGRSGRTQEVRIWDARTFEEVASLTDAQGDTVATALTFGRIGSRDVLVSGLSSGVLTIREGDSWESIDSQWAHSSIITALCMTHWRGRQLIVSGGHDGVVRVWSRADRLTMEREIDLDAPVTSLAPLSEDRLAIGTDRGLVVIRMM